MTTEEIAALMAEAQEHHQALERAFLRLRDAHDYRKLGEEHCQYELKNIRKLFDMEGDPTEVLRIVKVYVQLLTAEIPDGSPDEGYTPDLIKAFQYLGIER